MKNEKKNLLSLLIVITALLVPVMASAESLTPPDGVPTDPMTLFNRIITWVMGIVGILAVAMVVWGGVQITLSGGDKDKHGKGIKAITYALIGLVIVLISYSIVAIVGNAITTGN